MQSILREKLIRQSEKLSDISNIYIYQNSSFVAKYIEWLEQSEKELSQIRSPLSTILQAEKGIIKSVEDGFVPEYIQSEKSIRKIQRAVAAQSLNKVSHEIYSKVESIDKLFLEISEKLSHAIALLATKVPELFKNMSLDENSVNTLWKLLSATPETIPMYNYFCSKLASIDIKYLIMDIIQNIINNRNPD